MSELRPLEPEWMRGATACADVGVFAVDAETRAVSLDPRAAEMLGLTGDGEVSFEAYLGALDASDRDAVARHVDAAITSAGDAYHDEFRTTGKRWIAADGRTRRERGRVRLLGLLTDVTLRRTTDDARSRLVDEMARSLRFNDMLIGVAAHDLRSPLAAVAFSVDLLERRVSDPQLETATTRIASSAQRMSRIVDQLLELTHARLDGMIPLHPVETDVAALVHRLADELTAGDPPAAIEVESIGDITCVCDPDRVAQVFSNLLGNAVRHSPGAVGVRAIVDGSGPGDVSITVTNQGAMTPDLIPTLFNPFRRRRSDRTPRDRNHGLGLGLYIARRIVQGHGGDITVTSTDESTAFRVELPRISASTTFSLNPERSDEDQVALQRLATDDPAQVTASMFGVLPIEQRAPAAFATLVERHVRILDLSLARQIYRDARTSLAAELRELAEQLGTLGGGAGDVAELHSQALKRAMKGAAAIKVQALVNEGRLIALELMGRLLTYYRRRSGFGSLTRARAETPE